MNITKKSYSLSIKATKNFQSVNLTEGFEVEVDKEFNQFDFEAEKQALKDRLLEETKKYLNHFVDERKTDDDINLEL